MPSLTNPKQFVFQSQTGRIYTFNIGEPSKAGREGFACLSSERQFLPTAMTSSLDSPLASQAFSGESALNY